MREHTHTQTETPSGQRDQERHIGIPAATQDGIPGGRRGRQSSRLPLRDVKLYSRFPNSYLIGLALKGRPSLFSSPAFCPLASTPSRARGAPDAEEDRRRIR